MENDSNENKNLKASDRYGLTLTTISFLLPTAIFLALGTIMLVSYIQGLGTASSKTYDLVTVILLYVIGALFAFIDIFMVFSSVKRWEGEDGEIDLARVYQSEYGVVGISFFNSKGQMMTGRAQGFFLIFYNTGLFRRGQRVFIYSSKKNIPVLLTAKGVKRMIGIESDVEEQDQFTRIKAKRMVGYYWSNFLTSLYFAFILLIGLALTIFASITKETGTNIISLLILGIFISVAAIGYIIFGLIISKNSIDKLFKKKGKVVKMKLTPNLEKKQIDGTYIDSEGKSSTYPLIGTFTKKYIRSLQFDKDYPVYLNDDKEAILLTDEKK